MVPNKSSTSSVDVGLRILIQISQSKSKSNFVVKPKFNLKKPTFLTTNRVDPTCFLKSCHLCNKKLSLDKDVYMYKGDQGFCSVECRERQIYMDEMKEIEESTKKMVASFRESCRRCETGALLEQFRQQHKPLSSPKDRAIFVL
ncbi:hypothetical protein HYC85_027849 [Camellia sinensis]|uniref:FLZ-type domain-containing protein n=1 Tax=Camellia sinensis TaxID=4442 RepID=A0A7J7FVI0_CAMSI|nr:hypothetical protein HYC85_027849 [Camellia sinensis]